MYKGTREQRKRRKKRNKGKKEQNNKRTKEKRNKGTKEQRGTMEERNIGAKKQKNHPIASGITRSPGLVSFVLKSPLSFKKKL